jgi:hypothetical protein
VGGILTIPEVGSEVLLLIDDTHKKVYYLHTVVDFPENEMSGGLKTFGLFGDNYVYSTREVPQKITFTNQLNAGLKITRKFQPDSIVAKVDLDSEKGKRISLNDSPGSDFVLVRNEHGDGITIASDGNDIHGERSIEVKSKGLQQFVSYQSGMNFYVIDGKDINIENYSTGSFSNINAADLGRFGNINIRSHNADVSLVGKGPTSQIFIVTPNSRIQIDSTGAVTIESINSISVKSSSDINLDAGNTLNITATNLNIKTTSDTRIDSGGNFSARSVGVNSLDGSQVHFNSQLSLPVVTLPLLPATRNDYGE